jgi:hypothetical protein
MKTGGVFIGECLDRAVGSQVWQIIGGYGFRSHDGFEFHVPDGFLTDYASVPRILWPLIPSTDFLWDAPSAGHDFLVRNRRRFGISLRRCHELFLEMLLVRGATGKPDERSRNVARAYAMYYAVYACNWIIAGPGSGETPKDLERRVIIDLRAED